MKTRHIAHIVIEAETPLKVGSNASDFLQDSPIQKDWNGLPMILGTSLTGVLRKDFKGDKNKLFGDENSNNKDAKGSELIISNALLLNEKGEVCEKLLLEKSVFLQIFDNLPIREHTVITDKGVSGNKFDEEVVYKGTRFKFSIEMIEDEKESFDTVLNLLYSSSFRLGGGSTKGFGKIKVVEIKIGSFDINAYENYSSSLNHPLGSEALASQVGEAEASLPNHTKYTLNISPEDFFIFGSGFGDSDADSTPVYEKVVDYEKKGLSDNQILIPASSIKGALAHRTVYHYNLLNKLFIGNEEARDNIAELFGEAKDSKEDIYGSKGKVIFSDCYQNDNKQTKIFDHVAIDRFTGGAMDGALFQEKTIAQKDDWKIEILLETIDIEEKFIKAFESALKDITTGMLPLGGMTTKGHGVFVGDLLRDGVKI